MQILYVIERLSGTGGLQRILIDKMNYLADHTANEIVLMTIWHDTKTLAFPLSKNVRTMKLNVPLPNIPGGYIPMLPLALHRFNKYVKRVAPDVTVVFRAMGAFLAYTTSWKGKKIYESHSPMSYMNHRWLYPLMAKKVDRIVCLTKGDAMEFGNGEKVCVIPNFTMISPTGSPDYNSKRCIWVGRLDDIKNPLRLIAIWQRVIQQHHDWHLDIYGKGPLHEATAKAITHSGLTANVIMHGTVTDIATKYRECSIALMTSRSEGMPLTLVEANTCGLPIVAFDCNYGPADIIRNGYNGMLIPYQDDDAMVSALSRLMADKELRTTMGTNGIAAAKQYQAAPIIAQWLKVFNWMV